MITRNQCLLDNPELIDALLHLKKLLYQDFVENSLQHCTNCTKIGDQKIAQDVHHRLIAIYNELSDIKRILDEEGSVNLTQSAPAPADQFKKM